MKLKLFARCNNAKKDVKRIEMRNRNVSSLSFNINAYFDQMSLYNFWFRVAESLQIVDLLHSSTGRTSRKRYTCYKITSCGKVLKILSCTSNWMDLEITFGIKSPKLCEIFRKTTDHFIKEHGNHVTQLKYDLLQERATLHSLRVNEKGYSLEK